jgi:hypothetical protein
MRVAGALLLTIVAAGVLGGCRWVKLPTFDESRTVELAGATQIIAGIDQGVGELTVRAAAEPTTSVTAKYTFAPENWRPEVSSSVEASTARLQIAQPGIGSTWFFGYTRNEWAVTLPTGVETDLSVKMGAGNANLDLRGIDVVALGANLGAGSLTIDLSGPRSVGLAAHVRLGAGEITIRVPRSMGVAMTLREKGVGDVTAEGFTAAGDRWTNPAYSGAGPKIEIDVTRGAGDVNLVLAD